MPKFRKNPVEIEAVQFIGDNVNEIWDAFGAGDIYGPTETNPDYLIITTLEGDIYGPTETNPDYLIITTLEGDMNAQIGDWIIKGIKGELYPCKPDIFESTYTLVED